MIEKAVAAIYFSAVSLFLVFAHGDVHNFPAPAVVYVDWLKTQPLTQIERLIAWVNFVSLVGSLMASIALFLGLLHATSKWLFLVSIFFLLFSELFSTFPLIITSFQSFLDSAASLSAGALISILFLSHKGKSEK